MPPTEGQIEFFIAFKFERSDVELLSTVEAKEKIEAYVKTPEYAEKIKRMANHRAALTGIIK